jgi:hypothetical protein
MATIINLDNTTPAPPTGLTNVGWQGDSSNPRNVSAYVPNLVGDTGSGGASGAVPAPAAGAAAAGRFLKADGTWALPPIVIGFVMNTGATGTGVGPDMIAPRGASINNCVMAVKASDPSVALTFTIKKNGTAVFTSSPTVAAGTAAGTVVALGSLTSTPLSVAARDLFTIDISSGSAAWVFTVQLET